MNNLDFTQKLLSIEDSMERFAFNLTYDNEKAKDLMQDTYLKALNYKDKYVELNNFKAWTFAIMKNTFINDYRKSVRKNTCMDNRRELLLLNNSEEFQVGGPDSELVCKEIHEAIDGLENEFKIPFKMHTNGFKYKEIAETLNLKVGTVKSRIFFTRKKLIEILQDYK